MFIRWERSCKDTEKLRKDYLLEVSLVYEPGDGKRVNEDSVEYLGSIGERFFRCRETGVKAFHQGIFWAKLDKRLNKLSLEPVERTRIEEQISGTIPRPKGDWSLWCVRCVPKFGP